MLNTIFLSITILILVMTVFLLTVILKHIYKTLCRIRGVKDSYKQKLENMTVKYEAEKERIDVMQKIIDKNKWNKKNDRRSK